MPTFFGWAFLSFVRPTVMVVVMPLNVKSPHVLTCAVVLGTSPIDAWFKLDETKALIIVFGIW